MNHEDKGWKDASFQPFPDRKNGMVHAKYLKNKNYLQREQSLVIPTKLFFKMSTI